MESQILIKNKKNMNKKISVLILSLFLFSTFSKVVFSAESCKYSSEIEQCM
jgi:hypothetical protein